MKLGGTIWRMVLGAVGLSEWQRRVCGDRGRAHSQAYQGLLTVQLLPPGPCPW